MAAVMNAAAQAGDVNIIIKEANINRLTTENRVGKIIFGTSDFILEIHIITCYYFQGLRDLLEISTKYGSYSPEQSDCTLKP
jgi:hypothetical protein